MRKCVNWLFLAGAGLFLVVAVIVFYYAILPIFVRKQVSKTLALNNGTDAWDRFVKLPVPLKFGVYFFNIVNLEGVLRGEKPIVQEVGPWIYKETREKFNMVLDDEKDTVKYQEKSFFNFDADASKPLTEDDYVQPANIIPQVVNTLAERAPSVPFLNEVLELGFPEVLRENYGMVLNRTVNEILFSGITTHCPLNASLAALTICSVMRHFPGIETLTKYPNGDMNVGILRFRNDTLSKTFEVYRGNKDFENIGKIVTVDGETTVTNWFGEECNVVAGSYGESLVKPFLNEDTSFPLFASDLCSTIPMTSKGSTSFRGIDCLRFSPHEKFLTSVVDYPENYCYCPGSIEGITLGQSCMRTGAMELAACHATVLVCQIRDGKTKVFSLCELARQLLYEHSVPVEQLAMWLCIAYYESVYNTSAVGPNSEDFGLLQISRLYWCDPQDITNIVEKVNITRRSSVPNVCNISCSAFLDDDIADDVKCAKTIYKEHEGFENDGFKAWAVYPRCRRQGPLIPEWCFPGGDIPRNLSSNAYK